LFTEDDSTPERPCPVTTAMEDYLKTIYKLQGESQSGVLSTSALAGRMGVSAPSASNMLKKLSDLRLVNHEPYHGVELTVAGTKVALETVRHHRLLERYLADVLGFSWDQVDAEAEKLEHVISEEFEDRIDKALGYPTTDPHGSPIPDRKGSLDPEARIRLTEVPAGASAVVREVSDQDPEMLRYLESMGMRPGVRMMLSEKAPFDGPLRIQTDSGEDYFLGREVAHHVLVAKV
jgi:DtxR family Mn-dependent transcriptional regulator